MPYAITPCRRYDAIAVYFAPYARHADYDYITPFIFYFITPFMDAIDAMRHYADYCQLLHYYFENYIAHAIDAAFDYAMPLIFRHRR